MHQRTSRFNPRLVDALVVAVVALPGLLEFLVFVRVTGAPPGGVLVASVVLTLIHAGALWWRRSHPLLVLAVMLVALVIGRVVTDSDPATFVIPYAAAYAVAAYGNRRVAAIGLAGMAVAAALDLFVANVAFGGPTALSPTAVLMVVSWGIGRYMRVRRDYLDTLVASHASFMIRSRTISASPRFTPARRAGGWTATRTAPRRRWRRPKRLYGAR